MTPLSIAVLVGAGLVALLAVARIHRLSPTWLPWATTPDSRAIAPGPPGDLGEEVIESVNELARGHRPWTSAYDSTARTVVTNLVVAAALATVAAVAWHGMPAQKQLTQPIRTMLPTITPIRLVASAAAGALAFGGFMLLWNRGASWFVNLLAQDEPAVAAGGVVVAVLLWPSPLALVGGGLIALAAVARYTSLLDFAEVLG